MKKNNQNELAKNKLMCRTVLFCYYLGFAALCINSIDGVFRFHLILNVLYVQLDVDASYYNSINPTGLLPLTGGVYIFTIYTVHVSVHFNSHELDDAYNSSYMV